MARDESEPERLHDEQDRRAGTESELADEAQLSEDRLVHERRADKADYLRRKLESQIETDHEPG